MDKPVPYTKEFFDYNEVVTYIEEKYKLNMNDVNKSHSHFGKWCNAKNYGQTDPAGKDRGSSQIWYAEYKTDADGEIKRPPYCNFWHWFVERYEVSNGCSVSFDVAYDIECAEDENTPDWVVEILKMFQTEFGDEIEMEVNW